MRPESHQYRQKAIEQYGEECQSCGRTDDLQVHHIVPVSDGGDNEIENLRVVCNSCHWEIHRQGPDSDGIYSLELASDSCSEDFTGIVHRELSELEVDLLSRLLGEGELKREKLQPDDYTQSHVNQKLKNLRLSGLVKRTRRGYYNADPRAEWVLQEQSK